MIEVWLAVAVGVLYGTGVYLLLRRSLLKFILALGLISNGTHLLIFTGGGLTRGAPPLIGGDASRLTGAYADPLPQALILTAIVISFGLTAFVLLLIQRTHAMTGTDDPERLTTTDHLERYEAPTIPPPNLPGIETGHGTEAPDVPPKVPSEPADPRGPGRVHHQADGRAIKGRMDE